MNDKQLHIIQMYSMTFQSYTRSGVTDGGKGKNRPTWQATCKNWLPLMLIFHF